MNKNLPEKDSSYCSIEHNRQILRYIAVDDSDVFLEPEMLMWNELARMRDPNPRCASRAYGFDCPNCHQRVQLPRLCGNRWQCPICARIYCSSEGRKLFTRLMSFNPRFVRFITLTTHPDDFPEWTDNDELNLIEGELHRKARELLKRFFGKGTAGIMVVHNWSTQDPLGRHHFHIHVIMPCLRHEKHGWIHLPKYIHEKRLEELKQEWGALFGRPWLDVHVEYAPANEQSQIRHWINYSIRRPVLDLNIYGLKHNLTFEEMTQEQIKRFWSHVLPRTRFRRVRTFGFLAGGHISEHLKSRGVSLQYAKDWCERLKDEESRIYCPHCHTDLTFMKKQYGAMQYEETVIEFVVHRKAIWNKYNEVAV